MQPLLTLNNDRVLDIVARAIEFTTDPSIEADIEALLVAEKELTAALTEIKAAFKAKLPELELNSIEGDHIKVTVSQSGAKYKLVDPTIAHPSLLKVEMDTKAVDNFVESHEKLPDGFEYNESRSLSVRVTIKGGSHD